MNEWKNSIESKSVFLSFGETPLVLPGHCKQLTHLFVLFPVQLLDRFEVSRCITCFI